MTGLREEKQREGAADSFVRMWGRFVATTLGVSVAVGSGKKVADRLGIGLIVSCRVAADCEPPSSPTRTNFLHLCKDDVQ